MEGCVTRVSLETIVRRKHVTHVEYSAATKRSLLSKIRVILINITDKRPASFVHIGANVVSKEKVSEHSQPPIYKRRRGRSTDLLFGTCKNIAHHLKDYFVHELRSLVRVSSFRHLIISILASVEEQDYVPATACTTPARLKMLLRPMLCTQHPSRAAITVTDITARPADRKNRDAFQHPGKTLESVAKPSTLKFAQCVLPNNLVQRLKIPTVGVYSSVPFPKRANQQMITSSPLLIRRNSSIATNGSCIVR